MPSSQRHFKESLVLMTKRGNGHQLEIENLEEFSSPAPSFIWRRRSHLIFILCTLGLFSFVVILAHHTVVEKELFFKSVPALRGKPQGLCAQPSIRREWRSLSQPEQLQYIAAVQCLRDKPSQLGLNQTLYDGFPWTHSRIGNYCMRLDWRLTARHRHD